MELKLNIGYQEILELIKQLPVEMQKQLQTDMHDPTDSNGIDQSERAEIPHTFESIIHKEKTYHLLSPLNCVLEKNEDGFIVESVLLGVVGSGDSREDAIKDFSQEFDYLHNKLIGLEDDKLSKKMLMRKQLFKLIVNPK